MVLFPNQVPSRLFRTDFPTRVLRVGVRISFVQEEQQELQCIPMTSAIYVLEDVSIHPDILIPPFLPGCMPILRQLLVRHNQVVEQ